MGADLIGYLLKGDIVQDEQADHIQNQMLAQAQLVFTQAHQFDWNTIDLTNVEVFAPDDLPELAEFCQEYIFTAAECQEFFQQHTPEACVSDFLEAWRHHAGRDICIRQDPDDPNQQLWFAGDMSWGDTPDGFGFQSIRIGLALGIHTVLNIR